MHAQRTRRIAPVSCPAGTLKITGTKYETAMTTGINILVDSIPSCLQIPLEGVQSDSVSYVFKQTKTGFVKQEIVTGPSNDINISIAAGLAVGDQISLNAPENAEDLALVLLSADEKQAAIAKTAEALAARMKIQQDIARTVKSDDASSADDGGGFFIMF